MAKQYLKFIHKSRYKAKLLQLLYDMSNDRDLSSYDIKKLQGSEGLYRVRIGTVRVIFGYQEGLPSIHAIDNRGDVY